MQEFLLVCRFCQNMGVLEYDILVYQLICLFVPLNFHLFPLQKVYVSNFMQSKCTLFNKRKKKKAVPGAAAEALTPGFPCPSPPCGFLVQLVAPTRATTEATTPRTRGGTQPCQKLEREEENYQQSGTHGTITQDLLP